METVQNPSDIMHVYEDTNLDGNNDALIVESKMDDLISILSVLQFISNKGIIINTRKLRIERAGFA